MTSTELINVLQINCSKLSNTLTDIQNLLPHFVEKDVIKFPDLEKINAIVSSAEKVQKLMAHISGPLEAGNTKMFYIMLRIMEEYGHLATKQLAKEMKRSIPVSTSNADCKYL